MSTSDQKPFDPCFTCSLPDCDEENPQCGLKRANAAYRNAQNARYRVERDARRSEQSNSLIHSSEVSP